MSCFRYLEEPYGSSTVLLTEIFGVVFKKKKKRVEVSADSAESCTRVKVICCALQLWTLRKMTRRNRMVVRRNNTTFL